MILALAALILLAIVFGGRRLGAGLKAMGRVWRPTAGLAALVVLVAALALAMREDWLVAAGLGLLSLVLALGARRRAAAAVSATRLATRMSPREARAILGLEPGAGPDAVRAAYRRLIRLAHPDHGGTPGLAAQLNLARDVLLGR